MSIAGVVYTVVISLCAAELIRGLAAARRTWSPHRTRPPLDAEHGVYVRGTLEAAFLSGGPARVADALIAGLHEDGRLVVAGPGVVGIPRPTARNAGEQAVIDAYAAGPSGALHGLRTAVMRSLPVQETGEALAGRGLVVRPGRQDKWRRRAGVQVLLSVFGFVVAGMLTVAQYAGDSAASGSADSVGDGIAMLLPAGIFGVVSGLICLSVSSKQLTLAGQYALREYVGSAGHLTGAAHLVATRGLAAAHPDLRAQLVAAARVRVRVPAVTAAGTYPAPYQGTNAGSGNSGTPTWCGSGGGGGGGGFTCSGGAGSACSGGGGSSCGGGGGSSCGGGGGSSCGGGGGSSCGGGGGGSSCGGGGSSCGGGS
ncbi:TIGR04222 domain-containing membrane protein [Streptomyces formicae]|uniref:Membrane protein n=1 Tax=Streptomyces formicae TaxID=1616117 RepID=A0A291QHN5_9ACTN|nr:TIGR04222 domain-containing membrane protein [Streptomyces formicae]ATL31229.1 membrane protein [Streptomyces formicae]